MKKNIADYLHLYLGCEFIWEDEDDPMILKGVFGDVAYSTEADESGEGMYAIEEIKPILRPLSDMTEEEMNHLGSLTTMTLYDCFDEFYYDFLDQREDRPWETTFEITRYLLTRGFDLFGLIESGLALDKTQQPQVK
jgi:hypothetical protein